MLVSRREQPLQRTEYLDGLTVAVARSFPMPASWVGRRMQTFARPLPVERQSFWLHLSRRSATQALVERLARAVESLHRDGSIDRLYQQALQEFGDDRMPA